MTEQEKRTLSKMIDSEFHSQQNTMAKDEILVSIAQKLALPNKNELTTSFLNTYGRGVKVEEITGAVQEFEIWMEGYAATGEHGTAQMIGKGLGKTFDEAVKDFMSKNPRRGIEENGRNRYMSEDAYKNRRSNWNIWACNLFDNETDARKSFG